MARGGLPNASRTPRGRTSTGQVAVSIRCDAAELSETRPGSASGRESITSRSACVVDDRRDRRAERRGESLGGLAGAAVGVADRDDLADGRAVDALGEVHGRDRDRGAAALEQALGGVADRDVALGGVGVRAEHDHVGSLALGERRQALGRGAVGHDVASGARGSPSSATPRSSSSWASCLGQGLAIAVGLVRVADVRERHLGAGAAE